jgi:hypothetical protein
VPQGTLTIPANSNNASFVAAPSSATTAQEVTLKATAGGVSKTFAVQLSPGTVTLSADAANVAFGNAAVRGVATQSITLKSTGSETVTVSGASLTGNGFALSGGSFPATLNPGQEMTLNVEFAPDVAGSEKGQLTVLSNASSSAPAIKLSGTGTPPEVELSWNAPGDSSDPVAGYIPVCHGDGHGYQPVRHGYAQCGSQLPRRCDPQGQRFDHHFASLSGVALCWQKQSGDGLMMTIAAKVAGRRLRQIIAMKVLGANAVSVGQGA